MFFLSFFFSLTNADDFLRAVIFETAVSTVMQTLVLGTRGTYLNAFMNSKY
jgi:hypothetical protein